MVSIFFPLVMFNLFVSLLFFRDIDKIDDLMQDVTEQQDMAREISEAISRPFGETFDEVHTFPPSKSILMAFTHSAFLSIIRHCHFLLTKFRFVTVSPAHYCYCKNVKNALYRTNSVYSVCFLRMSCWQSLQSWNRRSLRKTWSVWVDSPARRAPNCLLHGPVSAHVSATLQRTW